MLDLHRLRLLRELRRRGTITAVAQAFSFSPSAVSQQLVTLERETGVRLLEQMERAEGALARSTHETSGTLAPTPGSGSDGSVGRRAEPDMRYTSADLKILLRLVQEGLAGALAGAIVVSSFSDTP